MGLFGSAGLKSSFSVAALQGLDIIARSISLTQATGLVAVQLVNGARLKLGTGTTDYLTSNGATIIEAAGRFTAANFGPNSNCDITFNPNNISITATGALTITANTNLVGNLSTGGSLLRGAAAPTIAAGAGASVVASNGTAAFRVDLGGAAQTGTITLPTAVTGWVLYMQNITNPALYVLGQTGTTTTTATFTNYSRTTGLAINWGANDNAVCIALAY